MKKRRKMYNRKIIRRAMMGYAPPVVYHLLPSLLQFLSNYEEKMRRDVDTEQTRRRQERRKGVLRKETRG